MAHGGTSFGLWAGANHSSAHPLDAGYEPTVTSYDYDAPIGEAGELTEKFHALREVIGRYLPLPNGELPGPVPRVAPQRLERARGRRSWRGPWTRCRGRGGTRRRCRWSRSGRTAA